MFVKGIRHSVFSRSGMSRRERRLPSWHPGRMQWHWGNIGSAAAGLAALLATVFTIYGVVKYGPAWLRDSRARQQAQAAAASEQAILARQQGEQISLERRRGLHGWS